MSIATLVIILIVLGVVSWLVYRAPMIQGTFKNIIYVVLVLIALLICASAFGLLGGLHQPVPKL